MHTKESLIRDLKDMTIDKKGTVLIHSSMKSIGEVDGRADTVLDALSDYMKDGLLALPTHTWSYINSDNPHYYVDDSPSCIGILPEIFRKRPNVIRSLHPTHSVAALGADAKKFVSGDEKFDTPCARGSAYGKLLDRKGTIMLVGVDLIRNTFIHGIEEWVDIPGRLTDDHEQLYTHLRDGHKISVPSRRHCGKSWSLHFWKVNEICLKHKAMYFGRFGDATVRVCDTERLTALITKMLAINPDLFSDNEPLDKALYKDITL
ncbi:aminoglycoside 3-N-acetyltransferase [Natranaerovirga hydrolytica]|uniref:Aminoglycoside N(3)-acetyltransferase n=1 Tax=Natranaerovirga hydrolytica TaxID=680378 RepID=A0A4R1MK31_9FIRM|nr:AAC(3) family N-acetyltransferase [Natranaerovirga hydrolytica]TCK92825.1 aminoglycoside 3-N-acetyltransferase [Natranaerovirga hydrolytica]